MYAIRAFRQRTRRLESPSVFPTAVIERVAPLSPMLLAAGRDWPKGDSWVLEPKWDGFRMLAAIGSGCARAWTRHGTEVPEGHRPVWARRKPQLPAAS